jgi:hypothetical protein
MPIIPAAQKVEIRKITVQGQPRQKVSETLSHPTSQVGWHMSANPAAWEV